MSVWMPISATPYLFGKKQCYNNPITIVQITMFHFKEFKNFVLIFINDSSRLFWPERMVLQPFPPFPIALANTITQWNLWFFLLFVWFNLSALNMLTLNCCCWTRAENNCKCTHSLTDWRWPLKGISTNWHQFNQTKQMSAKEWAEIAQTYHFQNGFHKKRQQQRKKTREYWKRKGK